MKRENKIQVKKVCKGKANERNKGKKARDVLEKYKESLSLILSFCVLLN